MFVNGSWLIVDSRKFVKSILLLLIIDNWALVIFRLPQINADISADLKRFYNAVDSTSLIIGAWLLVISLIIINK